jgi:hypothetical protein
MTLGKANLEQAKGVMKAKGTVALIVITKSLRRISNIKFQILEHSYGKLSECRNMHYLKLRETEAGI